MGNPHAKAYRKRMRRMKQAIESAAAPYDDQIAEVRRKLMASEDKEEIQLAKTLAEDFEINRSKAVKAVLRKKTNHTVMERR
jgi:hypothetical protein